MDLNIDEILLLQDGHCFRDGILNLCKKQQVIMRTITFKLKVEVLKL
jgi:LysR family hydrogen peroxide-inducible transcriptional activator